MTSPVQRYGPLPQGRAGWEQALTALTKPAMERAALGPDRQPSAASSNDAGATWWELLTRPLWGLQSLHDTPIPETIGKAVDPEHEWYVGPPGDRNQRLVEAAAVGFALPKLWPLLGDRQRDHLGTWLDQAARAEPHPNNWHFFPVFAGRGLDAVGFPRSTNRDEEHLERLDGFYIADGWYQDGETERYDYYNPFGFHFYNLILGRRRDIAAEFAQGFQYWFADDGSALPVGRSLGYRMAQGAFWGALAYAGLEALPWGRIRGLADRHLRWWWGKPVLDGAGLLTVGYAYPNSGVAEQYLGAGSPFWGTKFFLPLALPPGHPMWTAAPEPAPDGDARFPGGLVHKHNGRVTLFSAQGWADWARGGEAKYAKFAYSTEAGFSIATGDRALFQGAWDSMLALSDDGGNRWRAREEVTSTTVRHDRVTTVWHPWPDVRVETTLIPHGDWHLRVHRLRTGRFLHSAEGAFSVPWTAPGPELAEGNASTGRASFANCAIIDITDDREGELVRPVAGTNLLHTRTVLPTLRGAHGPGEHVLTCAVYLGDGNGDEVAWSGAVPDVGGHH